MRRQNALFLALKLVLHVVNTAIYRVKRLLLLT